jgi:hypothetical protein
MKTCVIIFTIDYISAASKLTLKIMEKEWNMNQIYKKPLMQKKINWAETKDPKVKIEIAIEESQLNQVTSENVREYQNIVKDIQNGVKFSNEVCNADNDDKVIALLNEDDDDIKKSIIFSFNVEKLWNIFETLDGVSKLVCVMMFSSYFISSCVLGLVINLYGNYLLDRFKLEEKYPKLAIFIKYRKTVSKYYILLNLLTILMICSVNFILGISILSLSKYQTKYQNIKISKYFSILYTFIFRPFYHFRFLFSFLFFVFCLFWLSLLSSFYLYVLLLAPLSIWF